MKNTPKVITMNSRSLLMLLMMAVTSCQNAGDRNRKTNNEVCTEQKERVEVDDKLLIGSWLDQSPAALHFTLFKDGTARSDNMRTLLYKSWILKDNQLKLTFESVGNGTSSMDEAIYTIENLSTNQLVIKLGNHVFEFKRK